MMRRSNADIDSSPSLLSAKGDSAGLAPQGGSFLAPTRLGVVSGKRLLTMPPHAAGPAWLLKRGPVKQKPRALLLAGIRAYADLADGAAGDRRRALAPATPARAARAAKRVAPSAAPAAGADASGDASFAAFAAGFLEEIEGAEGGFALLRP
jgi:hypothetical protein